MVFQNRKSFSPDAKNDNIEIQVSSDLTAKIATRVKPNSSDRRKQSQEVFRGV